MPAKKPRPSKAKLKKPNKDRLVPGGSTKRMTGKLGRPRIEVNWELVDGLCAIHCTGPEIAEVTGISEDTLTLRSKEDHGMLFTEYIAQKRNRGNASLRRLQWKAAEAGDKTMLVWLGKNWLKQTDRMEQKTEHSGSIGPVVIPSNDRDPSGD